MTPSEEYLGVVGAACFFVEQVYGFDSELEAKMNPTPWDK
jgi:hypothetical protein